MRLIIAAIAAALMWLAGPAEAQTTSAAAAQVVARHRAASGGSAWNQLRGLHETGVEDGVRYEAWYDPLRYGVRIETQEPAGRRVRGFNGVGAWQISPDRVITGRADRASLAQARSQAYLAAWAFLFPSRFAADTAHLGVRQARGRSFDVIRVQPTSGEPRELWFDRSSRLLSRVVDRTGGRPVTTELSDYRRVGRLLLPFRAASDRGGRPSLRQVEAVTTEAADRTRFSWTEAEGTPRPQ
ncbi:hypothetical protein [Phenylobacterium sp.]|jgi:hypothetical protein|uniref:hypothetical protein n=1 Tax=Phenylobacterium sp. TaxID=1871053 RepID=UPI002F920A1C